MALYQFVQRLLLAGANLNYPEQPAQPDAPRELRPLVTALSREYQRFDARAVDFGQRYRSGYWAIYLLSALAVLSAVMPLALGWDSPGHRLHPFSGLWAAAEVVMIGTVSAIYWLGNRHKWQQEWLRARTNAELIWYLPMLAPLLPEATASPEPNWYLRVFDPGTHVRAADEVGASCARIEPMARHLLAGAWSDPRFVGTYAEWTVQVLELQRHYHQSVSIRQRALEHRVHHINTWLFGLTALGAVLHLVVHTLWLSLVTTFLPALGASLHGALAQSESHRLDATSRRLVQELDICIGRIKAAMRAPQTEVRGALRAAVEGAISVILDEHQDWNLLVRPHHLPLG